MKAKLQNFIIYSNVAYKIISATVIAIIKFSFKPDQSDIKLNKCKQNDRQDSPICGIAAAANDADCFELQMPASETLQASVLDWSVCVCLPVPMLIIPENFG